MFSAELFDEVKRFAVPFFPQQTGGSRRWSPIHLGIGMPRQFMIAVYETSVVRINMEIEEVKPLSLIACY